MIDRLISFLQAMGTPPSREAGADDPKIATIGLCFQVMAADGVVTEDERRVLADAISREHGLEGEALRAVLNSGEAAEKEAVDFYRFTSVLKRSLEEPQRNALVGLLWDIVYADGIRHEVEDNVIWRIADLLAVDSRERVEQRVAAEKRAGLRD